MLRNKFVWKWFFEKNKYQKNSVFFNETTSEASISLYKLLALKIRFWESQSELCLNKNGFHPQMNTNISTVRTVTSIINSNCIFLFQIIARLNRNRGARFEDINLEIDY